MGKLVVCSRVRRARRLELRGPVHGALRSDDMILYGDRRWVALTRVDFDSLPIEDSSFNDDINSPRI